MFGLKLRDSVLGYLQEERFKGKQSTRHLVKQSIATVVYLEQKAELPLYREYIETPLLEASKRFFEVCGKSLLENEKCSNDFLEKVFFVLFFKIILKIIFGLG